MTTNLIFLLAAMFVSFGVPAAHPDAKPTGEIRPPNDATTDLTKIDRTIRHQPTYQSQSPKYCLLVFGPRAQTKAWMVIDGDSLYVDERGNGNLRDAKRLKLSRYAPSWFKAGKVQIVDNETKYVSAGDWYFNRRESRVRIDFRTAGGWNFAAMPRFSDDPSKAPIVHIGGPLAMKLSGGAPQSLKPGKMLELQALLGTHGIGDKSFTHVRNIPGVGKRYPQAEIEFPVKGKVGDLVKRMIPFKWCECCGGLEPSRVQVPIDVRPGKARLTLSFPAWNTGKVTPAMFEIAIVDGVAGTATGR